MVFLDERHGEDPTLFMCCLAGWGERYFFGLVGNFHLLCQLQEKEIATSFQQNTLWLPHTTEKPPGRICQGILFLDNLNFISSTIFQLLLVPSRSCAPVLSVLCRAFFPKKQYDIKITISLRYQFFFLAKNPLAFSSVMHYGEVSLIYLTQM